VKEKSRKILKAAWEAIGIEPLGDPICGIWEYFYTEYAKSEPLSAVMERAIQHCQASKVRLPRSFYDAKHLAEEAESTERFPKAWEVVAIKPCGSLKFVLAWEKIYGDSLTDEGLSVTMGRAIKDCEVSGIKVPSQFLAAKRGIEEKEAAAGVPKTPGVGRSQSTESIGRIT
jgi:hypothetical protein